MEDRELLLNRFYKDKCQEENRLESRHGSIEFLTTTKYIEKYLKDDAKILEVGAGTGKYSLYYADKGYDVTAIEYVEANVQKLKSNIKEHMNIKCFQGDAVNLVNLEDNYFDVTLVLGPLYHLYTEKEIDNAIKEAIRVTKKDGIIAFAYLTSDSIMVDWGIDHLLDGYPKDFDENFKMTSYPGGIFRAFYIDEFKQLMSNYKIEYLHNIATDGMTRHIKEKIDALTEEEFAVWLKYHFTTCERIELQGYSNHMLYICRKK